MILSCDLSLFFFVGIFLNESTSGWKYILSHYHLMRISPVTFPSTLGFPCANILPPVSFASPPDCLDLTRQVVERGGLEGADVGGSAPEIPHLTQLSLYSLFCFFLGHPGSDFSVCLLLCPPAHPVRCRVGMGLPGFPPSSLSSASYFAGQFGWSLIWCRLR